MCYCSDRNCGLQSPQLNCCYTSLHTAALSLYLYCCLFLIAFCFCLRNIHPSCLSPTAASATAAVTLSSCYIYYTFLQILNSVVVVKVSVELTAACSRYVHLVVLLFSDTKTSASLSRISLHFAVGTQRLETIVSMPCVVVLLLSTHDVLSVTC